MAYGQECSLLEGVGTYVYTVMLAGYEDIHAQYKQMGNSAAMIERHYSELTATLMAENLA